MVVARGVYQRCPAVGIGSIDFGSRGQQGLGHPPVKQHNEVVRAGVSKRGLGTATVSTINTIDSEQLTKEGGNTMCEVT